MSRHGFCTSGLSKETVLIILLACFAVVVVISLTTTSPISGTPDQCSQMIEKSIKNSYTRLQSLLAFQGSASRLAMQRNELSRQLNEMKKMVGQLSCRELDYKKKLGEKTNGQVSVNGGWCAEDSSPGSKQHVFDEKFANAVGELLKGKNVGSFGEGPGDYKTYFDKGNQLSSYIGYDGAPFCETVTQGKVLFLDLTAPQFGLSAFDWVISVEVGEHISSRFEDIYLDNLSRHAKEGIILSWARPGQSGHSHVNMKTPEEVVDVMEKRGFSLDEAAGAKLRECAERKWLKSNVQVFHRSDPLTFVLQDV